MPEVTKGKQPLPDSLKIKIQAKTRSSKFSNFTYEQLCQGSCPPEVSATLKGVGAKAYVTGNNIILDSGVNIHSPEGEKIVIHELAHTMQMTDGQLSDSGDASEVVTRMARKKNF